MRLLTSSVLPALFRYQFRRGVTMKGEDASRALGAGGDRRLRRVCTARTSRALQYCFFDGGRIGFERHGDYRNRVRKPPARRHDPTLTKTTWTLVALLAGFICTAVCLWLPNGIAFRR